MTKLRPAYLYLAVSFALIAGWFYHHIQPEYRLQLTCKGAFYVINNGEEVSRNRNEIFGIIVHRYDVLWGDGAYVWMQRATESLRPYGVGYENIKNHEKDGGMIHESHLGIQISYKQDDAENLIMFWHATQTLHAAKRKGDRVESFDGECRQTKPSDAQFM
jgi:hypothetical protein